MSTNNTLLILSKIISKIFSKLDLKRKEVIQYNQSKSHKKAKQNESKSNSNFQCEDSQAMHSFQMKEKITEMVSGSVPMD